MNIRSDLTILAAQNGAPGELDQATMARRLVPIPTSRVDDAEMCERLSKSGKRSLRMFLPTSADQFHKCSISGIFETHPHADYIVIGIANNGYEKIGDLDAAAVSDVFAGVGARFDEVRWFIESLKGHLRMSLGY